MDQAGGWVSLLQRHLQGAEDDLLARLDTHGPADDPPQARIAPRYGQHARVAVSVRSTAQVRFAAGATKPRWNRYEAGGVN